MALVVLPEGQQRSGKQGGIVWSRNRAGAYVRNRAVPVNPNSATQVAVRNAVRALTIRWSQTLTQVQRDAWDLYASNVSWTGKLGQSVSLTGLNHYVRSNTEMLRHNGSYIDAAPTIFELATAELALAVTMSAAAQTGDITYDDTADWNSEDGAAQHFYMGAPQDASHTFFKGPFKYWCRILGNSGAPPASPLAGVAVPWPIAQGQRVWVRSRILRADGRLSEFAEVNFLVAA